LGLSVRMTSNAASTLNGLIAPLTEAEFMSLMRDRRLALLRGTNEGYYADLIGWDGLRRMIERGEHPRGLSQFRLSKESESLPPNQWLTKGKIDVAKLEQYLAEGFNLIITHIEPYVPPLAALCDDIRSHLVEGTYAGVIVTTGSDGAFRLHYDFEDLIILQVEGAKRWQIFGPPVAHPIRGMPKPPPPESEPIFEEVLQPGDFLFVPAGTWHHCENVSDRSIHLGIFFVPPTGWDAAKALTSQLLSEELFRVPLTRVEGVQELVALEADIKNRLIENISQLKLNDFIAKWDKRGLG
jgi:hypothetical protein